MTIQEKLNQLKAKIITDNPTPELAKNAKNLVFGEGSYEAEIIFVGEAPGKKEDESGRPFVGASGRFLDELLEGINLKRDKVYITNIVKYRPPNNRDPKPAEKEASWPYLVEQINIIKPKVVATLGRHSGQAFVKSLRIGVDHGKPQTVTLVSSGNNFSVTLLPLYHPAAALYNGKLRKAETDDFKLVKKLLLTN